MDVILVPGLWLDASTWSDVAERLEAAGHRPHALTLRGLSSRTADRQGLMLADHVAEIVDAVDRCDTPVVLVGHAEACGLVHAAVNRRPDRIARAIHVGGLPSADGTRVLSGFAVDPEGTPTRTAGNRVMDTALAGLYRRRDRNGAGAFDSVQRLTDERRFDVPITVVATEYRSDDVLRWIRAGIDPARELARMTGLTLVDLPSGRWPDGTAGRAGAADRGAERRGPVLPDGTDADGCAGRRRLVAEWTSARAIRPRSPGGLRPAGRP